MYTVHCTVYTVQFDEVNLRPHYVTRPFFSRWPYTGLDWRHVTEYPLTAGVSRPVVINNATCACAFHSTPPYSLFQCSSHLICKVGYRCIYIHTNIYIYYIKSLLSFAFIIIHAFFSLCNPSSLSSIKLLLSISSFHSPAMLLWSERDVDLNWTTKCNVCTKEEECYISPSSPAPHHLVSPYAVSRCSWWDSRVTPAAAMSITATDHSHRWPLRRCIYPGLPSLLWRRSVIYTPRRCDTTVVLLYIYPSLYHTSYTRAIVYIYI